jgi:NTE family protein
MSKTIQKSHKQQQRPSFHTIALLLQGGGSLGAYQGGVYQALVEANIHPDWIAGTSIGAFNAAIIAGNPPEKRVQKLREFWEYITTQYISDNMGFFSPNIAEKGELVRSYLQEMSAIFTTLQGVKGFFKPRFPTPWLQPLGTPEATSYYDPAELRKTLMRFVDFDLINSGKIRFFILTPQLIILPLII